VVAAEEGDYTEAVRLFTAATTADPECAALHEMLAQCALQDDQDAVALTAAQRAVDLEPECSACKRPAHALLSGRLTFPAPQLLSAFGGDENNPG